MKLKKIDSYQKNVAINYIVKIFGIVISMLGTRVTIDYLGNNLYGLWVTIASIVSWMSSGDFGVGNGLRNKYAEAYAKNNIEEQKALIATGIYTLTRISVLLLFVGCLLCEILIHFQILQFELRIPMDITVVFFCINLVLSISQTVSYGQQKSWYVSFASAGMTTASLVIVFVLKIISVPANLTLFSIIHGISSIIPNIALIYLLKRKGTDIIYHGVFQNFRPELIKHILRTGMDFFGIQICSIVLYSTDNLIINYLIDGEAVTKYSIITKIYDTGQTLFSILLIALWSAVTYQAARNNTGWIKKKIQRLLFLWLIYVGGIICVSLRFNTIVRIWIGANADHYEPEIIVLFALYGIVISFSAIFVNIVNGLNQVKIQLILSIVGATMNIPLSIYFAKYLGMGIFGVKLATLVAAVLTACVIPIQVWLLLYKDD